MKKRITVSDNGRIEVQTDNGVITENGEKIIEIKDDFAIDGTDIQKLLALQENRPLCRLFDATWHYRIEIFNSNSEIESFFNSLDKELKSKLDAANKKISELESMPFWQRLFYKKDKK